MNLQASSIRRTGGAALVLFLFVIPFSKAVVEIFFPVLLLLWLFGWKRPFSEGNLRSIPAPNRNLFFLLALYLIVCLFSVSVSSFPELSLRGFIGKTLEYALLFIIAADLAAEPRTARRAMQALLAAAGLVILWGLVQEGLIHTAMYQGEARDFITGKRLDYVRMVGPYENPNDLATFLMVAGLAAAGWALRAGKSRITPVLWVSAALIAACLSWTRSMGGLLGAFCGLALLGWIHRDNKQLLWSMAGAAVAAAGFFLITSSESLDKLLTFSDIASNDRASMWQTGWSMFKDRPLFGHGLNTFMANYSSFAPDAGKNPAYAHNCYLQMAAETGILGLSIFVIFLTGLSRHLWSALRMRTAGPAETAEPELRAALDGISAALLGFLVQSTFDTNFYALRQAVLFWTLAGAAVALSTRLQSVESRS